MLGAVKNMTNVTYYASRDDRNRAGFATPVRFLLSTPRRSC